MLKWKSRVVLALCLSLAFAPAYAGAVADLEREATKEDSSDSGDSSSKSSSSRSYRSYDDDDDDTSDAEAAFALLYVVGYGVAALAAGGGLSADRYNASEPMMMSDGSADPSSLYRRPYDPILPMFKASTFAMKGSNATDVAGFQLEAGIGPLGISYTQHSLKDKTDTLDYSATMFHYRMSGSNDFSIDLAFGGAELDGENKTKGKVFAVPMRARLSEYLHVEYYPMISRFNDGQLRDHKISLNFQKDFYGVSVGMRSFSAGDTTINGLFGGLYMAY